MELSGDPAHQVTQYGKNQTPPQPEAEEARQILPILYIIHGRPTFTAAHCFGISISAFITFLCDFWQIAHF